MLRANPRAALAQPVAVDATMCRLAAPTRPTRCARRAPRALRLAAADFRHRAPAAHWAHSRAARASLHAQPAPPVALVAMPRPYARAVLTRCVRRARQDLPTMRRAIRRRAPHAPLAPSSPARGSPPAALAYRAQRAAIFPPPAPPPRMLSARLAAAARCLILPTRLARRPATQFALSTARCPHGVLGPRAPSRATMAVARV